MRLLHRRPVGHQFVFKSTARIKLNGVKHHLAAIRDDGRLYLFGEYMKPRSGVSKRYLQQALMSRPNIYCIEVSPDVALKLYERGDLTAGQIRSNESVGDKIFVRDFLSDGIHLLITRDLAVSDGMEFHSYLDEDLQEELAG